MKDIRKFQIDNSSFWFMSDHSVEHVDWPKFEFFYDALSWFIRCSICNEYICLEVIE